MMKIISMYCEFDTVLPLLLFLLKQKARGFGCDCFATSTSVFATDKRLKESLKFSDLYSSLYQYN